MRALSIQLRLFDTKNPEQAYAADVILAYYADVIKCCSKLSTKKTLDKGDKEVEALKDQLERMLITIDMKMKKMKWKFIAGNNLRSADFCLFYLYDQYAINLNFVAHTAIGGVF